MTFANIFKIIPGEGFADDLVGWWQVDLFPSRSPSACAFEGEYFPTWEQARDAALEMVAYWRQRESR